MAENNKAGMGLLNTLIILLLACTLVLFYVWLGGILGGKVFIDKLPDFVGEVYSHIWKYLTGGAVGSAVLVLIQGRKKGPNYLLWSFGASLVILLVAVAIGHTVPQGVPRAIWLKFSLQCKGCNEKDKDYPILSFLQKHPVVGHYHAIAHEKDYHYEQEVYLPKEGERFLAHAVRGPVTDSDSRDSNTLVTAICFRRNPKEPNTSLAEAWMACPEGGHCSISPEDPGWIARCIDDERDWTQLFEFVPRLHADEKPETHQEASGWKVPSLETLAKMSDQKRIGYTEFTIQGDRLSGLEQANALRYLIKANGLPLYVDGWPREDMVEPFNPSEGLKFSFGLQNLSFSGADKGCEKIEVSFEFLRNDEIVKQATLSRRYAALRDARPQKVSLDNGTAFSWSGTYKKPKNEDKFEVFVASTSSLRDALIARGQVDGAKLIFADMNVVGVLRPPLDKPWYGIAFGLRQPTGQIRFTFDETTAQQILAWVSETIKQHPRLRSIFRPDTHPYEMKPGDSGVGKLNSCNE
jgi:hypothetical protein